MGDAVFIDSPVSVETRFYFPVKGKGKKRAEALAQRPAPTHERVLVDTSERISYLLNNVVYCDLSNLIEWRATRGSKEQAGVEVRVTKWTVSFQDTDDICLEANKLDALRKSRKRTAKRYRVRALNEIVERQLARVHVEIYRHQLFDFIRLSENMQIPNEGRRKKLDHDFIGLVDIETGSIYRDGVCVSSSQLEIIGESE
jgi:hypothetical protein